jgi:hypothetical protein
MWVENFVAHLTQEEFDVLPRKRPEYRKGAMWLEPSRITSDLSLHVLEGEEAPCRAQGCNCYVGDLMTHVYRIELH